jgi:hypothetical protein
MVTDAGEGTGNCIFPLSRYNLSDDTYPRDPDGLWGDNRKNADMRGVTCIMLSGECGRGGGA